ncbi:glycoside hydrolase family 97 C-terminal domain-containing protein [Asticcacaulis sp.]|uniref:glycoside hydrolase family 97 C-terminal domain-containing protein n=1 Tax=Asticcacaulis sp. TaxID=1872648 RepID=UPI00391A2223
MPGPAIPLTRRKGKTWYIGLMNDNQARAVKLQLSFLPQGTFTTRLRTDGAQRADVVTSTQKASNTSVLTLNAKPSGGSSLVIKMRE